MIYVDSCVPMYLIGAEHPNKRRVMELASSLLGAHETLVTSAEAFQEIIHRYRAIGDLTHLHVAYEALEEMVTRTEHVTKQDTDLARTLTTRHSGLSARDCLHAAVMRRLGCQHVWTYDAGFDELPAVTRVC